MPTYRYLDDEDVYNDILAEFSECYKAKLSKSASIIHNILYSNLGLRPGDTISRDDLGSRLRKLPLKGQHKIDQLYDDLMKKLYKDGVKDCFDIIGDELDNDDVLDGYDASSSCGNGWCDTYVRVGNKAYELYINGQDYKDIRDSIMFEDIGKLNLIPGSDSDF
jgi:hypothetical protein